MKVCKFHAKQHIDSVNPTTDEFNLILDINGRCECIMGYPESRCGNTAFFEYILTKNKDSD